MKKKQKKVEKKKKVILEKKRKRKRKKRRKLGKNDKMPKKKNIVDYYCNPQYFMCGGIIPSHHLDIS